MKDMVCGSELREKIRQAIIKKGYGDPQDRFRIIRNPKEKDGIYEVQVQWDKYDLEVLGVDISGVKLLKALK